MIPEHIKTQARVLMFAGYSSDTVADMLRQEYGDAAPEARTLRRWREASPEMSAEERELVRDNNTRLALRFDALIDKKLDLVEQDLTKVRLPELVMGAGVFRDKERAAAQVHQVTNVQLNTVERAERKYEARSRAIEGETVEGSFRAHLERQPGNRSRTGSFT